MTKLKVEDVLGRIFGTAITIGINFLIYHFVGFEPAVLLILGIISSQVAYLVD